MQNFDIVIETTEGSMTMWDTVQAADEVAAWEMACQQVEGMVPASCIYIHPSE